MISYAVKRLSGKMAKKKRIISKLNVQSMVFRAFNHNRESSNSKGP